MTNTEKAAAFLGDAVSAAARIDRDGDGIELHEIGSFLVVDGLALGARFPGIDIPAVASALTNPDSAERKAFAAAFAAALNLVGEALEAAIEFWVFLLVDLVEDAIDYAERFTAGVSLAKAV